MTSSLCSTEWIWASSTCQLSSLFFSGRYEIRFETKDKIGQHGLNLNFLHKSIPKIWFPLLPHFLSVRGYTLCDLKWRPRWGIIMDNLFRSAEWDLLSLTSARHAVLYSSCCGPEKYVDITYYFKLRYVFRLHDFSSHSWVTIEPRLSRGRLIESTGSWFFRNSVPIPAERRCSSPAIWSFPAFSSPFSPHSCSTYPITR